MKEISITREEFRDTLCEIVGEFMKSPLDVIMLSIFSAKAEIAFFGDDDDEPEQIEARFKVGDKVRVRDDLEVDEIYGDDRFVKEMSGLTGKIVTITSVCGSMYSIKEDGNCYNWTDEMFDDTDTETQFKVGDKVFVIDNEEDDNCFVNQVVTITGVYDDGCRAFNGRKHQWIHFNNLRKVETP